MPPPHRVVAGLLTIDGAVLLCRRSPDRAWFPGVWDLPGGHIEPDEQPADALTRELYEELAVRAEVAPTPLVHLSTSDYELDVFVVHRWDGAPRNAAPMEHDAIGLFTPDEAAGLHLADDRYLAIFAQHLHPDPRPQVAAPAGGGEALVTIEIG